MPLVKLILVQGSYYDDDYGYNTVIRGGIDDWEDLTEDEFEYLRKNLTKIKVPYSNMYYNIVVKETASIREMLLPSIKEEVAKYKKLEAERKAAAEKKRLDKEIANKAKTEAKEREQLEKLREKYGA